MYVIKRLFILFFNQLIFWAFAQAQNFEIIYNDVTTVSHALSHAAVLNDSTIIAVGGYGWGAGSIIKSTNYGQSWTKTEVLHNLFHITFVNDSVGYAVGEGATVMKTIDGGENWIYQNTSAISTAFQLRAVAFADENVGFVGSANGPGFAYLLYTSDGGENWESMSEAGTVYGRAKIQVVDDSTVYSLGHEQHFFASYDLGQNWQEIPLPEGTGSSRDMYFFNRDTGIVAIREFSSECGSNFFLVKTLNGGESWQNQYFPCQSFRSIVFPTNQVGFALSFFQNGNPRMMWRTMDSGENWELFEYPVGEEFYNVSCSASSIACVDADTCYMTTNYGTIIKMTNATDGMVNTQQVQEPDQFFVYPNPTRSHLTLTSPSLLPGTHITVYNLAGQLVFGQELSQSTSELVLDARQFGPAGMYLLHVQPPGMAAVVKKVVVQE